MKSNEEGKGNKNSSKIKESMVYEEDFEPLSRKKIKNRERIC